MLDPRDQERGTLIAQLVLSPGTAFDLRDSLVDVMAEYTRRGQPPLED